MAALILTGYWSRTAKLFFRQRIQVRILTGLTTKKKSKKRKLSCRFWRSSEPQNDNKRKWKDWQMLKPCQSILKKTCGTWGKRWYWLYLVHLERSPKAWKKDMNIVNQKNRDYQDHRIVELGQNTERSPGDLSKLAVIQTSVENHKPMVG